MRIAVLTKCTLAHSLGGIQVHAEGLLHGLAARGHELVVLTTSRPGQLEVVGENGREVHFLAGTESSVYSRSWWRESAAAFEWLHRRRPFDLVVSEDLAGSHLLRVFPHLPHLPFLHGLVLEHVVSEFRQIEGVVGALKYPSIKLPEMIYYTLFHERPLVRRAAAIGVTSRRVGELIRRCYRVPEGSIRLLPTWVDTDLFRPHAANRPAIRRVLKISEQAFVLLMVSILTKQKGVQVGVEAFARCVSTYPECVLLVVGDGPYRPTLERQVRALGVEARTRFVGAVSNAETAGYYAAADAFLFPSLRMEGSPYVLLEAMASALPVIASRIGGVPETLGNTGFLVPAGDVLALAAATLQLLGDPHLVRRMGQEARERVKRLYAREVVLGQVEEACQGLIEARP